MSRRLDHAPHSVYAYFDADEQPLYVGCTFDGPSRQKQHGVREWWPRVAYAHFEHFDNKADARVREDELIDRLEPKFNRRPRAFDGRRKGHLLDASEDAA